MKTINRYTRSKNERIVMLTVIFFVMIVLTMSIAFVFSKYIETLFSVVILLGIVGVVFILRNAKLGLLFVVLILPISWTSFFDNSIMDIPGFKIPILLSLATFVLLGLMYKRRPLLGKDRFFIYMWILLFTIAIARSYDYLAVVASYQGHELTIVKHILSNYLRQLLIFLLFPFFAIYLRNKEDVIKIIKVLLASILLAFGVILLSIINGNFTDFNLIRIYIGDIVGMHPGYFANYFVILLPLTLLLAIKAKWKICYLFFGIEIVSIAMTFSRASYVVSLICIFIILALNKKWWIFGLIGVGGPTIISMVPDIVINRLETGLAAKNVSEISAGRVYSIWMPLIRELLTDKGFLLFGNGKYGIYNTAAFKSGSTLEVNNAHNILLDAVCDGGILLLIFFLLFFGYYLVIFLKGAIKSENDVYTSVLLGSVLGIGSFLVKGMTDGVFWAESSNAFIYVLLGLNLAIVYLLREEKREHAT